MVKYTVKLMPCTSYGGNMEGIWREYGGNMEGIWREYGGMVLVILSLDLR
jgi:hypothetical protein